MGFKERLIERKKEKESRSEVLKQKREEDDSLMEKLRAEKREEVDNLALAAQELLKPFLRVVNEVEFNNEGVIKIKSGVLFDGYRGGNLKEYSESFAEVELYKVLHSSSSPGCFDSCTEFYLRLHIGIDREVKVRGSNDNEDYASINLNDENAREEIENAILSILQTEKVIHYSSGQYDRSI